MPDHYSSHRHRTVDTPPPPFTVYVRISVLGILVRSFGLLATEDLPRFIRVLDLRSRQLHTQCASFRLVRMVGPGYLPNHMLI